MLPSTFSFLSQLFILGVRVVVNTYIYVYIVIYNLCIYIVIYNLNQC